MKNTKDFKEYNKVTTTLQVMKWDMTVSDRFSKGDDFIIFYK